MGHSSGQGIIFCCKARFQVELSFHVPDFLPDHAEFRFIIVQSGGDIEPDLKFFTPQGSVVDNPAQYGGVHQGHIVLVMLGPF